MNEKSDEPAKQSAEPDPSAAQDQPRYREVSQEELNQILAAHQKWLESDKKEGKQADLNEVDLHKFNLGDANLQGADLWKANLGGANLWQANLQGAYLGFANLQKADLWQANLGGANLQGANLEDANLEDANLQGANFKGAKLQKAHLEEANLQKTDLTRADLQGANLTEVKGLSKATLQNANLDEVTGLLGSEFARADVTGTKLPEDIRDFKVLQVVEEISKNARKIFLSMLLACVYSWLTIATTTDARLLTNSASSPLPIIGTEIPIAYFYWAAPFILIAFYIYLHFYLQRLWKGLAGLPAIFPDGKSLDERAYPWLLNGLVRRHFERLKKGRPLMAHLEEWVTILLAWWVVPLTLIGFWVRYLPRHEWGGTWIHVGLLVASVAAAIIFYRSAARTLRGAKPQSFQWKASWRDKRTYQTAGTALMGVILLVISYGAINGARTIPQMSLLPGYGTIEFDNKFVFTDVWTWVPWTLGRLGSSPFADFRETDVSLKPANYWELSPNERNKSVQGASLKERDLRYADAAGAFLSNADLRDAQLQGANLNDAQLQGANLGDAQLQGANLRDAQLQGANLIGAQLQGTNLSGAQLQGANLARAQLQGSSYFDSAFLSGANLQGANLFGANLQGVYLGTANLQGANLIGAYLQGADFRLAKGATPSQIKRASYWELAFYNDDFLKKLGLPADHNETVKKKLAEMEEEKAKTTTKP